MVLWHPSDCPGHLYKLPDFPGLLILHFRNDFPNTRTHRNSSLHQQRGISLDSFFAKPKFVPSISGKTFKLFNPATEEKLVDVCEGDENDVDAAVEAAKVAFKTWKDTPASVRGDLLRKLGQLISENTGEIAYLDAVTMGGPSARAPFLLNWVCGTIFNRIHPTFHSSFQNALGLQRRFGVLQVSQTELVSTYGNFWVRSNSR